MSVMFGVITGRWPGFQNVLDWIEPDFVSGNMLRSVIIVLVGLVLAFFLMKSLKPGRAAEAYIAERDEEIQKLQEEQRAAGRKTSLVTPGIIVLFVFYIIEIAVVYLS